MTSGGSIVRVVGTALRDGYRGLRGGRRALLLSFGILTLAMTAATAIFSVVDAVALRPLPFREPDRLVSLMKPGPAAGRSVNVPSQAFFAWREQTHVFEGVGGAKFPKGVTLATGGSSQAVSSEEISPNLFDVLGVPPAAGRFFSGEDEHPGAPPRAVLSFDTWRRVFNSDPRAIGRLIQLGPDTREIIGVVPDGIAFPITAGLNPDVYVPYVATAAERANSVGYSTFVVARLRAGVTLAQARPDVEHAANGIVTPLQDQVVGPAKAWLELILAAGVLVLLVAYGNVAIVLFARAMTRRHELTTRQALGASRSQVALSLVAEGVIVAAAAAAAALVLAQAGLHAAVTMLPAGLTRVTAIGINSRVLFACSVTALVCGALSAGGSAWLPQRDRLVEIVRAAGRGRRGRRLLSAFLILDAAFVAALLVATGVVLHTFVVVNTADLGFDRHHVVTIWFSRSVGDIAADQRDAVVRSFQTTLIDRVRAVPGVAAAALSDTGALLSGTATHYGVMIPGYGDVPPKDAPLFARVSPEYFAAMGIKTIRGRVFQPPDEAGDDAVAVISQFVADTYFRGRDPIGQVISIDRPLTIVGVVADAEARGPEGADRAQLYLPLVHLVPRPEPRSVQGLSVGGNLVIRASEDPRLLAPAVLDAIRPAISTSQPPSFMDDSFQRLVAQRRFNAALMSLFGLVAIAIGTLGVYGTMAFLVEQQVPDLAVHIALGAPPATIRRRVLTGSLLRAAAGCAVGLIVAAAASNTLRGFIFGVQPIDPIVEVGVVILLAAAGVVGALGPARRAVNVDPIQVLRQL